MSDRERWVIYPLLFLALGSAVIDKIAPGDAAFNRIACRELVVGNLASDSIECRQLESGVVKSRLWVAVDNQGRQYPWQPGKVLAVRPRIPLPKQPQEQQPTDPQ